MHMIIYFLRNYLYFVVWYSEYRVLYCKMEKKKKKKSVSLCFKWLSWKKPKNNTIVKTSPFPSFLCPRNKQGITSLYHSQVYFRALQTSKHINGFLFMRLSYCRTSMINRRWNMKICSGKTLSLPCIL